MSSLAENFRRIELSSSVGRAAWLCGLSLVLLLGGCRFTKPMSSNDAARSTAELTISAAASLKDAFSEIARMYENRSRTKVNLNFGASGILQKQIEAAAPIDLFASAGSKQMDELAAKSLLAQGTRQDFARNALVLVVPASALEHVQSFSDLDDSQISRIVIGNPKTVPAGHYAEQMLTRLKLLPQIQSKLILAEDARQALDYVVRGEVQAGLVYASDAFAAGAKVKEVARAPEDTHDPILYPIAVVKESRQPEAARQFIDFVLSAEGQSVLTKYGFSSVK